MNRGIEVYRSDALAKGMRVHMEREDDDALPREVILFAPYISYWTDDTDIWTYERA